MAYDSHVKPPEDEAQPETSEGDEPAPLRLFTRSQRARINCIKLFLTRPEIRMARAIRDTMDVPYTTMFRLILRDAYVRIFGEPPKEMFSNALLPGEEEEEERRVRRSRAGRGEKIT